MADGSHDVHRSSETVVAVVVTHNRLEVLGKGVEAVLAEPIDHVVIVDNRSTDGTADWLAAIDDPRVVVLTSDRNLGGAGGFEYGMRHAMQLAPDWILLLDDDARPSPGSIKEFRRRRFPPDVGGVGAAVYSPTGRIVEVNRPGLNPFTSVASVLRALIDGRSSFHVPDEAFEQEAVDVDCISFVGYFVRADLVVGPLGYPPGEFFIYADDQYYSFRVRQLGYRNVLVPAIEFVHETATYASPGAVSPLWKSFYLYRNSVRFYREMAGPWFPLVIPVKLAAWIIRVRRYPDKRRYLRLLRLGVSDGLRGRFDRPHDEVVRLSQPASQAS